MISTFRHYNLNNSFESPTLILLSVNYSTDITKSVKSNRKKNRQEIYLTMKDTPYQYDSVNFSNSFYPH